MHEIIKALPDFGGYEASSLGYVVYNGPIQHLGRGKGRLPRPGQHLHQFPLGKRGYPAVSINGKKHYVHTLMASAFHGPRPEGHIVRHLDDVPTNNVVTNIAYGTRHQNALDRKFNQHPERVETYQAGIDPQVDAYVQGEQEAFAHVLSPLRCWTPIFSEADL